MRLDLVHPAVEKVTLVLEGIGEGKVRVNSASLDNLFVILAGKALEIVGIAKKIMMGRAMRSAYWLDHDPSGLRLTLQRVRTAKVIMARRLWQAA